MVGKLNHKQNYEIPRKVISTYGVTYHKMDKKHSRGRVVGKSMFSQHVSMHY